MEREEKDGTNTKDTENSGAMTTVGSKRSSLNKNINSKKNQRRSKKYSSNFTEEERLENIISNLLTKECKKVRLFLIQKFIKQLKELKEKKDIQMKADEKKIGQIDEKKKIKDDDHNHDQETDSEEKSSEDKDETNGKGGPGDNKSNFGKDDTKMDKQEILLKRIQDMKAFKPIDIIPSLLRHLRLKNTGKEFAELAIKLKDTNSPLNSIYKHSKIQELLKQLDRRVIEFRRGRGMGPNNHIKPDDTDRKETSGKGIRRGALIGAALGDKALFIDSLSGHIPEEGEIDADEDDDENNAMLEVGPYGYTMFDPTLKKNRPGQRQRRMKMEAIRRNQESPLLGGGGGDSTNRDKSSSELKYGKPSFVPRKKHEGDTDNKTQEVNISKKQINSSNGNNNRNKRKQTDINEDLVDDNNQTSSKNKRSKIQEKKILKDINHGSWLAKLEEKEKLANAFTAYSGKKIVFDDDDED